MEVQDRDGKVCDISKADGNKPNKQYNQMILTDCCSLVASLSQCICPEYLPWWMVFHCRQDFGESGKGNSQAVKMGLGCNHWKPAY